MNTFSFYLIVAAGFLIGLVFSDLLEELGLEKKYSRSGLAVIALALISFTAFITYSFFMLGVIDIGAFSQRVGEFYNASSGVFLWMTVALIVGGFARIGINRVRERKPAA